MALIPYLNIGDSLSASAWNTLWAEFDRKLTIALNNRPIFYWNYTRTSGSNNPWKSVTGRRFFFISGATPVCNILFPSDPAVVNYNHATFTALKNQSDTSQWIGRDDDQQVLVIKEFPRATYTAAGYDYYYLVPGHDPAGSLLDMSLEVLHQSSNTDGTLGYSLIEQADNGWYLSDPQMVLKYNAAEIILEGITTLTYAKEWDKYLFIRISNFNNASATVNFQGTDGTTKHSIAVPAFGSATVRRDNVDSGYEDGGKYFWNVHAGDPQSWTDTQRPENNCVSPSLALAIIGTMAGADDTQGAKVVIDPTKFWDASSQYCGPDKPFAVLADATLIGDLLIHKGNLLRVSSTDGSQWTRQTIAFNTFASIIADWTAAGLTIAESGSGDNRVLQVTGGAHDDLISSSTNILLPCGSGQPAQTISSALTLPRLTVGALTPELTNRLPLWAVTSNTVMSRSGYSYNRANSSSGGYVTGNQPIHRATVADMKSLGFFTNTGWTAGATFSAQALQFTGFGPIITYSRALAINGDFSQAANRIAYLNADTLSGSGATLKIQGNGYWHFSGWGWQDMFSGQPHLTPDQPRWLSPYRASNALPLWSGAPSYVRGYYYPMHPNYTYYWEKGAPIKDSDVIGALCYELENINVNRQYSANSIWGIISAFVSKSAIAYGDPYHTTRIYDLTGELDTIPGGDTTSNKWWGLNRSWALTSGSDVPGGYGVEINPPPGMGDPPTKTCFHRLTLLVDHYNNIASLINGIVKIRPIHFLNCVNLWPDGDASTKGIFGTDIRPRTQYAKLTSNVSVYANRAASLGIPIKSLADLPSTYADLLAAKNGYGRYEVKVHKDCSSAWVDEGGFFYVLPTAAPASLTGAYGGFSYRTWTFYSYIDPMTGSAPTSFVVGSGHIAPSWIATATTETINYRYVDAYGDYADLSSGTATKYTVPNLIGTFTNAITSHGIAIYNGDALPGGAGFYDAGEGTANTAASGMFLNSRWKGKLFGNTSAAADSSYYWIATADVKTAATALGFDLQFVRAMVPLHLQIEDASLTELYNSVILAAAYASTTQDFNYQSPVGLGGYGGATDPQGDYNTYVSNLDAAGKINQLAFSPLFPARFAAWVEKTDGEWMVEPSTWRLRKDYAAPDVFIYTISLGSFGGYAEIDFASAGDLYLAVNFSDDVLRRNWQRHTGENYVSCPADSSDWNHRCMVIQGGMTGAVVLYPTGYFGWPNHYSTLAKANADAVIASGWSAVPATSATAGAGDPSTVTLNGDETIVDANSGGTDASMVMVLIDGMTAP